MAKWSGSSKELLEFEDEGFRLGFEVEEELPVLFDLTKEIWEYRLHAILGEKQGKGKKILQGLLFRMRGAELYSSQ